MWRWGVKTSVWVLLALLLTACGGNERVDGALTAERHAEEGGEAGAGGHSEPFGSVGAPSVNTMRS